MFQIQKLINNKNNNISHSKSEINYIVNAYLSKEVCDISMTDWLKAVIKSNMNFEETVSYTNAIINSGSKLNFNHLDGYIVDKHSTGGIGDKVSLILGPILAACGCYVPMIVGRMLAHTGGTLDKLESIEGYNGLLNIDDFSKIVKNTGISIIGQTDQICPADRQIYQLRGKTNTVASLPLICGSIMSKKIAEGINGLILDIKIGNGAFIKNNIEAIKLGDLLTSVGNEFGIDVKYISSNMNQPLGSSAGLLCEVEESINALKGNGNQDLMSIIFELGNKALKLAKIKNTEQKIYNVINNGSALDTFYKMIRFHGGKIKNLKVSYKYKQSIKSKSNGILNYNNMKKIGHAINYITITNGKKDINAGMKFYHKNYDQIKTGDTIFDIFGNDIENIQNTIKMIENSYMIK